MAKTSRSESVKRCAMTERYTERDGRELACHMLHELDEAGDEACAIESTYREDGAPQCDAVARYLAVLRERQSAELNAGFAAILTEVLGDFFGGDSCGAGPWDKLIEAQ